MMTGPTRRIVTGHDANGKAIIQEDGPVPRYQKIGGEGGPMFHEVWNTTETPARIDAVERLAFRQEMQIAEDHEIQGFGGLAHRSIWLLSQSA